MEFVIIIVLLIVCFAFARNKEMDPYQESRKYLMQTKYPFNVEKQNEYQKKLNNYYFHTTYSERPKTFYSETERMMFDKDTPFNVINEIINDRVQEYMHSMGHAYAPGGFIQPMYKFFPEFGRSQFATINEYMRAIAGLPDSPIRKNDEFDTKREERWKRELDWLREYQKSDRARKEWYRVQKYWHVCDDYPDKITF